MIGDGPDHGLARADAAAPQRPEDLGELARLDGAELLHGVLQRAARRAPEARADEHEAVLELGDARLAGGLGVDEQLEEQGPRRVQPYAAAARRAVGEERARLRLVKG